MVSNSPTYQEQAYEYIKSAIMNLVFKPGEYITDNQVGEQLNISRTPVREAFRRLELEGLLDYESRRGWKVYSLSIQDINEIFDLKIAIEGMIARKAAESCSNNQCEQLREITDNMKAAVEKDDVEEWVKLDPHLHKVLFEMANNQRALKLIENLNDQWHRVRIGFTARTDRMRRSMTEHEAIVEAVIRGDGDEAERKMQEHLNLVREELVNLLVKMVLPFAREGV